MPPEDPATARPRTSSGSPTTGLRHAPPTSAAAPTASASKPFGLMTRSHAAMRRHSSAAVASAAATRVITNGMSETPPRMTRTRSSRYVVSSATELSGPSSNTAVPSAMRGLANSTRQADRDAGPGSVAASACVSSDCAPDEPTSSRSASSTSLGSRTLASRLGGSFAARVTFPVSTAAPSTRPNNRKVTQFTARSGAMRC